MKCFMVTWLMVYTCRCYCLDIHRSIVFQTCFIISPCSSAFVLKKLSISFSFNQLNARKLHWVQNTEELQVKPNLEYFVKDGTRKCHEDIQKPLKNFQRLGWSTISAGILIMTKSAHGVIQRQGAKNLKHVLLKYVIVVSGFNKSIRCMQSHI